MKPENIYRDIISTDVLADHLADPDWLIVDCRFELADPDWGETEYAKAHIPGAIYAHLERDLSGQVSAQTGRHPLPDPTGFTNRLSSWGVNSHTQVVVYDQAGGAFASRLWWLLKYYGHDRAAVLDGGYAQWLSENREVNTLSVKKSTSVFHAHLRPQMLASVRDVEEIQDNPAYKLVDARAPARYRGEIEPIDPVAGHIPGAVNRFHNDNLQSDGKLLPTEKLKQQFSELLGTIQPENAIVYCGSGVTSCHHILAMSVAGMPLPRLYAGSWSEWIRDSTRPIDPKRI